MLADIVASVIGGGATGLFGVAVQRFADYQNKKLDIEIEKNKQSHELQLRDMDAKILKEEWSARVQVAQVEGESRIQAEDSKAFAQSFNEPQMYSAKVKLKGFAAFLLVVLDFARGIVRPGLTVYLCVLTTLVYQQAHTMTQGIDVTQALEVVKMSVQTILYLTSTCVLWWFGTRNRGKPPLMK